MSMSYWMCAGIGIRVNQLYPHLNKKKCIEVLIKQLGEAEMEGIEPYEFEIDDYMFGEPFANLGDFLCTVDDTNTLTYGDNGYGEYYFYYTPSYPWERSKNEPVSIQEVHERIIDAVIQVCNLSRAEIEAMIDDEINDVGCG